MELKGETNICFSLSVHTFIFSYNGFIVLSHSSSPHCLLFTDQESTGMQLPVTEDQGRLNRFYLEHRCMLKQQMFLLQRSIWGIIKMIACWSISADWIIVSVVLKICDLRTEQGQARPRNLRCWLHNIHPTSSSMLMIIFHHCRWRRQKLNCILAYLVQTFWVQGSLGKRNVPWLTVFYSNCFLKTGINRRKPQYTFMHLHK